MRVSNHELTVRRGESFTIDKIVQNRDGSPYIISSRLANPYFVITVSSTLYLTDDSYIYHAWLPIVCPRFYSTVAVCINDFKDENGETLYPTGFEDMTGLPSGYVNDEHIAYTSGSDALFYYKNPNGDKIYRYWSDSLKRWEPYECRIIYKFLQEHTRDWVEKNYFYNIDLLDGEANEDFNIGSAPLKSVIDVIPILEPTKLSVLSNLKGGMPWLDA